MLRLTKISFISLIISFSINANAQIIKRFETDVSYVHTPDYPNNNISIQGLYKLNDFISSGLIFIHNVEVNPSEHADKDYVIGATCSFHALPLILERRAYPRFDLYIKPSIEYFHSTYFSVNDNDEWEQLSYNKTYFATGLGLVFYPWKRVGLFAEYTGFWRYERLDFRYAVGLKFRF